jgi:hypothetical protein
LSKSEKTGFTASFGLNSLGAGGGGAGAAVGGGAGAGGGGAGATGAGAGAGGGGGGGGVTTAGGCVGGGAATTGMFGRRAHAPMSNDSEIVMSRACLSVVIRLLVVGRAISVR